MLEGSSICSKGELYIFAVPPTLSTIQSAQINDYYPLVAPIGNTAPIEFTIPRQVE